MRIERLDICVWRFCVKGEGERLSEVSAHPNKCSDGFAVQGRGGELSLEVCALNCAVGEGVTHVGRLFDRD